MSVTAVAREVVARLVTNEPGRTEADLQAEIYTLLIAGGLSLSPDQVARLEVPTRDGTRRRLDVEVGHAVIEVKRNLATAAVRRSAEDQLAGYVISRTQEVQSRFVGILTDGLRWHLYHLQDERLVEVNSITIRTAEDAERLCIWIEGILATERNVTPTPLEIDRRLGANSSAYKLERATLLELFADGKEVPEVALKRQLWAKLLRTSLGKAFVDNQDLFIDHTLLVLSSEIIAHAVLGFDLTRGSLPPASIVRGTEFVNAQIYGVVEADFFDWVMHVEGGPEFVELLAERIGRFNWAQVEHDVLKVLYESIIVADERAALGEYYTPDWLADRMIADVVNNPLGQRVLDPACGSGTFLFHAIKSHLNAADDAGHPNGSALSTLTTSVFGIDVHPVAVTLARVTYLLAIGKQRITAPDRGPITIPVYLGDSLQWEQRTDLLGGIDNITVSTRAEDIVDVGSGSVWGDDLIFPNSVLEDARNFDRLVTAMADKAVQQSSRTSGDLMRPILRQFGISGEDGQVLIETFDTMRRLHAQGRDHIWGYYVRNLIRPLWMSEPAHRVDVLVGNPPWLRYSKMMPSMQERYKVLTKERKLLTGGLGASARDLSTLFVVRAVELYLKQGGKFSFVMPHGVLTRKPHEGFRSGSWNSSTGALISAKFDESWDLAEVRPTGFPMTSAVVRGVSSPGTPKRMPAATLSWSGRLPKATIGWSQASGLIATEAGNVIALSSMDEPASPYKTRFRNGAILYPRRLMFVVDGPVNPLGPGAGRVSVASRCTNGDKPPWKNVSAIGATVERAYLHNVHLGETIVPYRTLTPLRAVLPLDGETLIDDDRIEEFPGLAAWWEQAEAKWVEYRVESEKSSLAQRINYHQQLISQFPTPTNRVVFTKAGNSLTATRIDDPSVIIDHKLYWGATSTISEGQYLVGIFNSDVVMDYVRPLMAVGLFGPRDLDKNVFRLAIPIYDPKNEDHLELVSLVQSAEQHAAQVEVANTKTFQQARKLVRSTLNDAGISQQINAVVARIVPKPRPA